MSELCTSPTPKPLLAAIYFVIFIILGALVLLTLFVGIVTTSMDQVDFFL